MTLYPFYLEKTADDLVCNVLKISRLIELHHVEEISLSFNYHAFELKLLII